MTGGLLITFREGLEAFLVVGIILSYLNRMGAPALRKWVYAGVGFGVVGAAALAFLFQVAMSGFENSLMEKYLKAGIMAFAVAVLTYMLAWMTANGRKVKDSVESRIQSAVHKGSIAALTLAAFLAVIREGFETVLFLGALYGAQMDSQVLTGALLGLAASILAVIAIFRGMRGLNIKAFFKLTGALILLISAGLLTNMIGILEDIRAIPLIGPRAVDFSWLLDDSSQVGIFFKALFGYTSAPSLLQIGAYGLYIFLAYYFIFREEDQPMEEEANLAHAN